MSAFSDSIDGLVVQMDVYMKDFQSRVARGLYSPTAAEQALVTAAFVDLQSVCATLNANPVAKPAVAASVVTIVQPSAAVTAAGGGSHTKQLYVNVADSSGSAHNRYVTWLSSAPAIATVSATGLLTGVAAGTSNITATSEGVTSAAIVCTTS